MQEKLLGGNKKFMKKDNVKKEDELRPEYDLMSLKVRKVGPERKSFFGTTVRLETDVAKVFPDSGSVNEALRFLIRTTQKNKSSFPGSNKNTWLAEQKVGADGLELWRPMIYIFVENYALSNWWKRMNLKKWFARTYWEVTELVVFNDK